HVDVRLPAKDPPEPLAAPRDGARAPGHARAPRRSRRPPASRAGAHRGGDPAPPGLPEPDAPPPHSASRQRELDGVGPRQTASPTAPAPARRSRSCPPSATSRALRAGPPPPPGAATPRQFLYARSETIMGGTSEIQRNVIAQRILGLPR